MRVQLYEYLHATLVAQNVDILGVNVSYPIEIKGFENLITDGGEVSKINVCHVGGFVTNSRGYFDFYLSSPAITKLAQYLYIARDKVILDDTQYPFPFNYNGDNPKLILCRRENSVEWRVKEINIGNIHLRPCKLLTPYGNHPIGECCMIDVLTNTLYFNQGSGAFSVEGECLYEFETPVIKQVMRKPSVVVRLREWLRNTGGAYINSGIRPTSTLVEYSGRFKVNKLGDRTCILSAFAIEQGSRGINLEIYSRIEPYQGKWDKFRWNIYGSDIPTEEVSVGNIYDYKMSVKGKEAYLLVKENGNDFVSTDKSVTPLDFYDNVLMFDDYRHNQFYKQDLSLGVTTINGTTFHPCEILYHPTLPPQSAMIDTNTGTIYTNQGTGNFTCEGEDLGIWTDTLYDDMRIKETKADMVCIMQDGEPRVVYERTQPWVEHKWLKGDGSAYVDTNIISNSEISMQTSVIANTITAVGVNNGIFGGRVDGQYKNFTIILQGNYLFSGFDNNYENLAGVVINKGDKFTIKKDRNKTYYNGSLLSEIPYASFDTENKALLFAVMESKKVVFVSDVSLGLTTIENGTEILHLTPIQLTRNLFPHEIASSNTALRGECGFADKEKYLRGEPWFYGNVATSGSFSVSDE